MSDTQRGAPVRPAAPVHPFPNLRLLHHPLILRDLSILRDVATPTAVFRPTLHEVATILAVEVTKELPLEAYEVETPLEMTTGYRLADRLIVVPILRAGLGMVDGFLDYLPEASVGHIGLYRDHETHEPRDYYSNLPSGLDDAVVILIDPMLASGGSGVMAVDFLKAHGAKRIYFACLVTVPEGVKLMLEKHPDVLIFAAALDRELNERKYILPGLGDAGDRMFGTA